MLPTAGDAAEIRVRARTRLTFAVARTGGGLEVSGRLDDDARHGVGEREITLSIEGWEGATTAHTGADGEFRFRLEPRDLRTLLTGGDTRRLLVDVVWAGDTRFGPARQERSVDVDKLDVDLSATVVPTMVVLGERRNLRLIAEAYSQGRAVRDLDLTVSIGGGPARPLRTGADGRATVGLSTEGLEGPGEVRVEVRAPEATDTNAAAASAVLLLVSPTTLTLDVHAESGAAPAVRTGGVLTDSRGPVEGGLVTLLADGLPVALAVTDEEGRWGAAVTRRTLADACAPDPQDPSPRPPVCQGSRSMKLRAAYSPAEPWRRPSVSETEDAMLPAPPRVPFGTYLWTLLLALGAIGAVQLVRLHPLAWLRARAARGPDRRTELPQPAATQAAPALDPVPAPPAAPDHLVGMVVDAATGAPVPDAAVRADGDGPGALTRADGRFDLGPLVPGEHALHIEARGFLPARMPLWLPRRGRTLVLLRSVRDEAATIYRSHVEPDVGPGAFGLLTPRDIAALLAKRPERDAAALARLTDVFEHVYYGDACAGPEAVERVRAAAEVTP